MSQYLCTRVEGHSLSCFYVLLVFNVDYRRVACRRLDNMVELTSHQFNILVFGLLG